MHSRIPAALSPFPLVIPSAIGGFTPAVPRGGTPTALPWLGPPLTPSIHLGQLHSWSFVPQEFSHQVITTASASLWVLPGNDINYINFSTHKVHFKYYLTQWTERREALGQQLKEQDSYFFKNIFY